MSNSVANHGIGIKKTGQDLVHWQVLLLFKRVWHVCTILRNKCKAMQYLSTHSKSTIPKSPESARTTGLSRGLTVSHDLSPESVNIFLQLSDGGGCDACRRTVRHCCNHVLRSIDPSPVWQADRLAATCIKQKVGARCSSHQKHSIKHRKIATVTSLCVTTLSLSRWSLDTSFDSTLQKEPKPQNPRSHLQPTKIG